MAERRVVSRTVRHSFFSPSAEELKRRYPVGSKVTIRYASDDGGYLSVIGPGFHWDAAFIGLIALAISIVCWRGLRPALYKRREHQSSLRQESESAEPGAAPDRGRHVGFSDSTARRGGPGR